MFQLQNLDTEVRPYLSRWYEESVMHIYRVVQMVQSNISFLLHAVSLSRPKVSNYDKFGPRCDYIWPHKITAKAGAPLLYSTRNVKKVSVEI